MREPGCTRLREGTGRNSTLHDVTFLIDLLRNTYGGDMTTRTEPSIPAPAGRARRPSHAFVLAAGMAAVMVGLTGCSAAAGATVDAGSGAAGSKSGEVTVLRYQGSANQVVLPELAEALGYLGKVKLDWVGNTISGPQDIQSVATNQTDVGEAFAGAVTKLETAGAPITAVVSAYGEDSKTFTGYYVPSDSPIKNARDLIGKKVAVNTLGAQAEAEIDTYLTKGGLTPAQIKQVQLVVTPPNNIEEAVRKGQVDVGALSGVLQDNAVAGGGLRPLFDDYTLFGAFAGGQYVFRNDFISANPGTVRTFVTGIAKAIHWENTTPRERVIAEFAKIIQSRGRNESTATLQYWKSSGLPGYGVIASTDFTRWTSWLHSTGIVSGAVDAPSLYTDAYNPYATTDHPSTAATATKGE
ncbi:ABC transporter substrate-binding protein [Humibacter ginsengiterrae]